MYGKFKARVSNATSLSTYDVSTLYTTLPHNLIKEKLIDLIERTFNREGEVGAPFNWFKPSCKIFLLAIQKR